MLPKGDASGVNNHQNPWFLAQLQRQRPIQSGSVQSGSKFSVTGSTSVSVQVLSNSGPSTTAAATLTPSPISSPISSPEASPSIISQRYSYKVKIINPAKKSDAIIRHLHRFTSVFHTVTALRVQLMEEFKEHVPATADFQVGYFETNQQSKVWLVTSEDLDLLYGKYSKGGAVTLWCDGRESDGQSVKRKRDTEKCTKRQEIEEEVASNYKMLIDTHQERYTNLQYRLWARMNATGLHDSMEDPPDIPALSSTPKRRRKDSLSDSLAGAAVALASAFSDTKKGSSDPVPAGPSSDKIGVSPGKAVELRMKNYQQLRYLQQLLDDRILSNEEFQQQKKDILGCLQNL